MGGDNFCAILKEMRQYRKWHPLEVTEKNKDGTRA